MKNRKSTTKSDFIDLDDFTATSQFPDKWCMFGGVQLYDFRKDMLSPNSSAWLDDAIISAFQNNLKKQYPKMGSLQSPIMATKMALKAQQGEFVQILNINWLAVSSPLNHSETIINVYNSLHMTLPGAAKKIIASLCQHRSSTIKVLYHDVQWQSGSNDCGVFAIAFATAVCEGKNPAAVVFDQSNMRAHLLKSVEMRHLSSFPERCIKRRIKPPHMEHLKLYCSCQLPDDGNLIIKCINVENGTMLHA